MNCLCIKCKRKVIRFQNNMKRRVIKHKKFVDLNKVFFETGNHYFEKARSFNVRPYKEINRIKKGEIIEVQSGMRVGEYKYIIRYHSHNKKTFHAIALYSMGKYTLINVYDPSVGMSFKWNKHFSQRVYFNELRSCCIHPEDHKKNFVKKHHGIRHKKYVYQK